MRWPCLQVGAGASDVCYGVSWVMEGGAMLPGTTLRPVTHFPLSHPFTTDPEAKKCLGYAPKAAPQSMRIPALGKRFDAKAGACAEAGITGGELLYNFDGDKSVSGLERPRRSRLVAVEDDAGDAYLVILNGAARASSGGRIGVDIAGRSLVAETKAGRGAS